MASNPVSISIPANTQGAITCLANAAYYQRVTLAWGNNSVVFGGTGEGQPMVTQDGQNTCLLAATDQEYQITATFEYSSNGPGGPFRMAHVHDPVISSKGIFTVIEVTSEDSTDNDYNDSYLTFPLITTSQSGEQRAETAAPETAAPGATGNLELHAKTYYNDPNVSGGDEHYITVPHFDGSTGSIEYSGTGWGPSKGGCYDNQTGLGGYLTVAVELNNCVHVGLKGATLTLTTTISYWGSKPTGYKSVTWNGKLYNTQYQLTRVVN